MPNLLELDLRVMRCMSDSFGADDAEPAAGPAGPAVSECALDDVGSSESCDSAIEAAVVIEWLSRERRESGGESSTPVGGAPSASLLPRDLSEASWCFSCFGVLLDSLRAKRRVVKDGAAGLSFGAWERAWLFPCDGVCGVG